MKRIFYDLSIIFAFFLLPYWVSLLFAFVGIFIFNKFFEFIVVSVLIYALYIMNFYAGFRFEILYTIAVFTIFKLLDLSKDYLRLNKYEI